MYELNGDGVTGDSATIIHVSRVEVQNIFNN